MDNPNRKSSAPSSNSTSKKNAPNKRPSAYDAALRAGLIGPVKLAPRDLSTNPKHLEGFGT